MMTEKYNTDSGSYLKRARKEFEENTKQSLIYAALELRSGIVARQREYFHPWDHISEKRKQGWRIPNLAKDLEKAFRSGEKYIEMILHDGGTLEVIDRAVYTPISRKLQIWGGKLGGMLHALDDSYRDGRHWWDELRQNLEEVYALLSVAASGRLLGPPMQKAGEILLNIEPPEGEDINDFNKRVFQMGRGITMQIKYHDTPPS